MAKANEKEEHVHKLKRHTFRGGRQVYFCVLDCNFQIDAAFALGKQSICHICGNEFTMNEYSIKLARPHCKNCGKMKVQDPDGAVKFVNKARATEAIAELHEDRVTSLRDRLGKVVVMEPQPDEVI
jgi:hypothetical protein